MNEILNPSVITDNKDGMTSLEIAEVTGKEHKNVMRDIRNILSQGVSQLNFELSSYKQSQTNGSHKDVTCYRLTPKGCLIRASGYDAALREKIIDRLEILEKRFRTPQTYLEALKALVVSEEQKEQLALENREQRRELAIKDAQITELGAAITEMQPKVSYVDMVLQCRDTVQTTIIAQDYGMSAKALNVLLRNMRVQRKVGTTWVVYDKYLQCGYVQSKTFTYQHKDGTTGARTYMEWTQKGRLFLYETLKSRNILPLIEQANV